MVAADIYKNNILPIKIDSDNDMLEMVDCRNDTNSDDSSFEDEQKDSYDEIEVKDPKLPKKLDCIPQKAGRILCSGLTAKIGRSC
eukprot:11363446-Ditylum_brightwellii.AAC.1